MSAPAGGGRRRRPPRTASTNRRRECYRERSRRRGAPSNWPYAALGAACFGASIPVFYAAGAAGLYLGTAPGAVGFVVWWCLVVAGIASWGEAGL